MLGNKWVRVSLCVPCWPYANVFESGRRVIFDRAKSVMHTVIKRDGSQGKPCVVAVFPAFHPPFDLAKEDGKTNASQCQ